MAQRSFLARQPGDAVRSELKQGHHLITNHTHSNLGLRPPSIKQTGFSPDEPVYRQLGSDVTEANGYAKWAAFQLHDTSGSVEDWSYWNTGGFGFTFEIGPDEFHPPYQNGVVAGVPRTAAALTALGTAATARRTARWPRRPSTTRCTPPFAGKAPPNRKRR